MLRILGSGSRLCDGVTRREAMRVGSLALFGTSLPSFLAAAEKARMLQTRSASPDAGAAGKTRAKAVILINLFGGPPHLDMFDLKPRAPANVRGEFRPIATSLPGVQICELMPQIAKLMDRATLIRTYSHKYNSHNPYNVLTGFDGGNDQENYFAKRSDHPSMASVCQWVGMWRDRQLPYVVMPAFPGYSQALRRAGPYGGYLGSHFDPVFTTCEPKYSRESKGDYDAVVPLGVPLPPTSEAAELTADRLDLRRTLLAQLDAKLEAADRSRAAERMGHFQRKAFALLSSSKVRAAFDLSAEPAELVDRFGRNLWGASALIARRLVEAGSTFVTVNWEAKQGGHWDLHENNFGMLKANVPILDRFVSALVTDLADRGLLDETLVVVMGEMGRTPHINAKAGRDHWPQCGFSLLFGGGTKRGCVVGATDKLAAYPIDRPVSAGDLAATIYELLGVDPHTTVPDLTGRPIHVAHGGDVVWEVIDA
jgi:hypothetical protein